MKTLFLSFCFMFVDYFSIFYLNILWAFLWPHLVTSDFAPFWGPPPLPRCWEYTPMFLLLWPPPSLTNSNSSSQGPRVCDLPWLHCSGLHASALSSHGSCADRLCLLSPNFVVANSLPPQVHEPLEGTGCVFLWGAQHRTCDYECLLNECWIPSDWPRMFESVI